jgi:hypothetical protein
MAGKKQTVAPWPTALQQGRRLREHTQVRYQTDLKRLRDLLVEQRWHSRGKDNRKGKRKRWSRQNWNRNQCRTERQSELSWTKSCIGGWCLRSALWISQCKSVVLSWGAILRRSCPGMLFWETLSPYIFLSLHRKYCHTIPASVYLMVPCGPSEMPLKQVHWKTCSRFRSEKDACFPCKTGG